MTVSGGTVTWTIDGVGAGPQAERMVAAIIRKATTPHKLLLDMLSSPFEIRLGG
jgi:hypothetical protein